MILRNFDNCRAKIVDLKKKCLQVKTNLATIVNGLSVLKLFQLSNGDLLLFRSMSTASIKCVKLE